ncbi:MAG: RNA polymerase sigma-70 factor (ECF subfamily) [Planctomycetota bacterium]|jgi:RNA polymerase sigma-70 factor (ECF subfamily)
MSETPESITALIPAVLRGETEAIDSWYRTEHPQVYRLCLGFLCDTNDADDVAQDAMLHLLDRLYRYDTQLAYEPWRTSVVLNLCRDRQRQTDARKRAENSAANALGEKIEGDAAMGTGRYVSRPDQEAERGEVNQLLTDCLRELTPREREVFVLRDLSQLSTNRVAKLLDIGESSVRSLLALARRRVRMILEPKLAEPLNERGLPNV